MHRLATDTAHNAPALISPVTHIYDNTTAEEVKEICEFKKVKFESKFVYSNSRLKHKNIQKFVDKNKRYKTSFSGNFKTTIFEFKLIKFLNGSGAVLIGLVNFRELYKIFLFFVYL